MALYAIGDVQGCDAELGALLDAMQFSADRDRLWFVGDLVNRGPDSLDVLRRIRALGDAATVILGNHDLHLLAVAFGSAATARRRYSGRYPGGARSRRPARVAREPAAASRRPRRMNVCMLHAGLAPQWDLPLARQCAREFESALRRDPEQLFERLYGDQPDLWDDALQGEERLRFIANCFTRLRYVDDRRPLDVARQGIAEKSADEIAHPLVRGAGGALAWAAHRLRSLVDTGFFRNARCHRPRHGLRLGRHPDRAAAGRAARQARAGGLLLRPSRPDQKSYCGEASQYLAAHQKPAAALLERHAGDILFQIAGDELRQDLVRKLLDQLAIGRRPYCERRRW